MDGLRISNMNTGVQSVDQLKEAALQKTQTSSSSVATGESFADNLKSAIATVDRLQKDADKKIQDVAVGRSNNIHETMIASEKADLALRLMVQVRNKVIDAYQEIMKMQV